MERQSELAAVGRALQSYYDAVAGGDAAAASRCFAAPAMFLTPQGGGTAPTTERVEAGFAAMLRDFKAQGYSHSTWSESHSSWETALRSRASSSCVTGPMAPRSVHSASRTCCARPMASGRSPF